jgi:hypothetical protein
MLQAVEVLGEILYYRFEAFEGSILIAFMF